MPSRILIRKDGKNLSEVPLTPPMTIGRHPKSSIQLEDKMMSREHAKITLDGARLLLTDTSANGVRLGGQRLARGEPRELKNGDVIEVPSYELVLQLDPEGVSETETVPGEAPEGPPPPPPDPNAAEILKGKIPLWTNAKDVELKVAEIIEETHDVKTFRLVGKERLIFSYRPGQYLTVKVDVDGRKANRCYTISSSPSRPHTLEITVKRARAAGAPDGLVSNYLHDRVKLGDTLRVHGPDGDFSCFNYQSRKILCIAAGSGITPIMSMCRWIADVRADVDVVVLLSFRTQSDIIFRRELEMMSSRHNDLKVLFSVTGRSPLDSWTGLTGRLCPQVFPLVVPDLCERHVFLCGPNPFMETVRACLKELNFPTENLHSESFGGTRVAPGEKPRENVVASIAPAVVTGGAGAAPAQPVPAKKLFSVSFKKSGVVAQTDGECGLLEVAEAHGVAIPAGCRMGSCLVCKVKLLEGEIQMAENKLTPDQKQQKLRVTCVGRPTSNVVVDA